MIKLYQTKKAQLEKEIIELEDYKSKIPEYKELTDLLELTVASYFKTVQPLINSKLREIENLTFGNPRVTTHKALFVVTDANRTKTSFLIKCNPSLEWLVDEVGFDMTEILGNFEGRNLPQECGVYSCDLLVDSYQDNTPDSCDWNLDITMKNIIKTNSLEIQKPTL